MRAFILFLNLALGLCLAVSASSAGERLWISFGGKWGEQYLMQIDAAGKVILPPMRVPPLDAKGFPTGAGALSLNGRNALNIWFMDRNKPLYRISRAVIEKRTLSTVRYIRTGIHGTNHLTDRLNVTSRSAGNFISFHVKSNDRVQLVAYPINEFGQVTGKRLPLSPVLHQPANLTGYTYMGGTSRDGRMVYWNDWTDMRRLMTYLYVRPLGQRGRPIMQSVYIDRIHSDYIAGYSVFTAADVSGALRNGNRFLVYVWAHPREYVAQRLYLQQIDARTGYKIGGRIIIRQAVSIGNSKVDPLGRFVLYLGQETIADDALLTYQALDSTGHPVGRRKVLTDMDVGIMDLLRQEQ